MTKRILIMGLPGSGKTTLAQELVEYLGSIGKVVEWFNADQIREKFNDWDFSHDGRIRQSQRMRDLADNAQAHYVVCDFVAPLMEMRRIYDANYTIWLDTIKTSAYQDTNQMFDPPKRYNFYIDTQDAKRWTEEIVSHLLFLENH